jgi:hypothetical protein
LFDVYSLFLSKEYRTLFFQHICINSTSFWGQFEGISGINPLSLYSNEKSKLDVCQMKSERKLKQTNKLTEWELRLSLDPCQCEVQVEKQFHKQQKENFILTGVSNTSWDRTLYKTL